MLEKGLHAGNLAAAFGVIATTADLTLAVGAATMFGAALSGVSLATGSERSAKKAARDIARDLDAQMSQTHLSDEQQIWLRHLLATFPPQDGDFTAADMDGTKLTALLEKRIQESDVDPELKQALALDAFSRVLPPVFAKAIDREIASNAAQSEMLKELLARTSASGNEDRLRDEGITEQAIIRLAQRIAAETEDMGRAWLELQNAMDIAVRVQAEGAVGSNHGDFVDEVLRRATELARDGDYTSAGAAIDEALGQADAEERELIDRSKAKKLRLLDKGVDVALLDRDTAKAAALLVRKADVEAGGMAEFEALRALRRHHYEIGRDKGRNLDSALAIDLAQPVLNRARNADQRGTARNDLGSALRTLGERESETKRLEQAVNAYEAALEERTRYRVPLNWAMTQMNLGTALQTLGARESKTKRLEQAVTAYEAALEEWTRDRVPFEWAMTQMNLGSAHATLGERESGTERLEKAVTAYEAALEELTRDRVPLEWGRTQMNLGNALQTLGERESGTERLEQAVAAYEAALEEWTRERVPLDWAMTQMNLGTALRILGDYESGMERLEQAVAAYEAALKEWTRERVPLDWARTQGNLATLEEAFFHKTGDAAHLERALEHAAQARVVFVEAQASLYVQVVDENIARFEALRSA